MPAEVDSVVRSDPFWLALERSRNALAFSPQILFEKKYEWVEGLNSDGCNELGERAGLGQIFGYDVTKENGVVTERWLTVCHPTIDAPIRWLCWSSIGLHDGVYPYQRKLQHTLDYLAAWQTHRAEQLLAEETRRVGQAHDDPQPNETTKDLLYLPASHYKAANGIEPSRLRKAAAKGSIGKRGSGKQTQYRDADVRRRWPEEFLIEVDQRPDAPQCAPMREIR